MIMTIRPALLGSSSPPSFKNPKSFTMFPPQEQLTASIDVVYVTVLFHAQFQQNFDRFLFFHVELQRLKVSLEGFQTELNAVILGAVGA